jgi:hypothetical protein
VNHDVHGLAWDPGKLKLAALATTASSWVIYFGYDEAIEG